MNGLFSLLRSYARPLCLVLAVYTFNFSIDAPDARPDSVAEDMSFNDIESFYEFLLEGVAGIDNAVAEHEEHDDAGGSAFDSKKWCLATISPGGEKPFFSLVSSPGQCFLPARICNVAREIVGPPPRA